jgi:hypothetical protein
MSKIQTLMNNTPKMDGCEPDLRSLLKHQHRKVYAMCRFFANNYREHQQLFINIIAAASQNIRSRRDHSDDKQTMLLRACINMAALHSIYLELAPECDRTIQFKSPDYQRSMTNFRSLIGGASDLEKIHMFLELEKVSSDQVAGLTGIAAGKDGSFRNKAREVPKKNFIPYLKAKLIWS